MKTADELRMGVALTLIAETAQYHENTKRNPPMTEAQLREAFHDLRKIALKGLAHP